MAQALLGGLIAFIVLFPLWFFRYARSIWLAFDQFWDPDKEEPSEAKPES